MGDDSRANKLRKLDMFRRKLPHMSASALAAVLKVVEDEGIPEVHNRKTLQEARDSVNDAPTPFGPIHREVQMHAVGGGLEAINLTNPFALIWTALKTSDAFSAFFASRLAKYPSSPECPWSLILYNDEVTPGNPLSTDNQRKLQAVYFSFMQFGANALSKEESWFTAMVERSTSIKGIDAGMSQAFGAVIRSFFDSDGIDMQTGGVSLPIGGHQVRVFAKLGAIVQDGGAHKYTWHFRNEGGTKMCLLCKNVFSKASGIFDTDGTNLLVCNVIREDQLAPATSNEIRNTARRLEVAARRLGAGEFSVLQQSLGMTHHSHALLLDRRLDAVVDPVAVYVHDWMHGIFVDGVYNTVVYLLFESCINAGYSDIYESFRGYLAKWRWPGRLANMAHVSDIFTETRKKKHRDAMHIKCQASELMSIAPVLALYVQRVLLQRGICVDECKAFLALSDVVDFITCANRGRVTPSLLTASVHKFLGMFVAVWGDDWLGPKFHWLLHYSSILERYGMLFNCYVHERFHRIAKRYATDCKNYNQAITGILREVTAHKLAMLSDTSAFDFSIGLVDPIPASPKVSAMVQSILGMDIHLDISTSSVSRFNELATCKRHDYTLVKGSASFRAAHVMLHIDIGGIPATVVRWCRMQSIRRDQGYSTWVKTDSIELIDTKLIIDAVPYCVMSDSSVGVLHPCDHR